MSYRRSLRPCLFSIILALVNQGAFAQTNAPARRPEPSTQQQRPRIGTGFLVAKDTIITAAHGLDGCRGAHLVDAKGATVQIDRVKGDRTRDLALVVARMDPILPKLPLSNAPPPSPGEPVYMMGFPLENAYRARLESFYQTQVVGLGGIAGDPQSYRLGFVALSGMSGAAVIDTTGKVVGMVKSHMLETVPNGGPTIGGQTLVTSGETIVNFLQENGVQPDVTGADKKLEMGQLVQRSRDSSVTIYCNR